MQPYELFIGLRYTRSRQRNRFISFISMVSVIGIALGITVLITVLSVMNGFRETLLSRILGVNGHVYVDTRNLSGQEIDRLATLAATGLR